MNSPVLSSDDILAARSQKNTVDSRRPYAFLVEPEYSSNGCVEDVATIFLTNRECPFRCLMCDLWKNTTDERVPVGAIPEQIDYALSRLPAAKHIKLYNSGNFFDRQAIPPEDYEALAAQLNGVERAARLLENSTKESRRAACSTGFETVIVENHPTLIGDDCLRFRDMIDGELEVAIGLETAHPGVLTRLNKQMTVDDFEQAVRRLTTEQIATRAFILLRPPFMTETEGVEWAIRSMNVAFDAGVRCCSLIPTRDGNGIMEQLKSAGDFDPPSLASLEEVHDAGLAMNRGRVFVDLWDIDKLFDCERCGPLRRDRLQQMNLSQQIQSRIECDCGANPLRRP